MPPDLSSASPQNTPKADSKTASKTISLALTGASGMPYGARLLECLLAAGCRVWLMYSPAAQIVAAQEMNGWPLPARPDEAARLLGERYAALPGTLEVFGHQNWFAPPASGSNPPHAMVVCPCSMGTLASIAQGLSDNLIERAADVVLKERRPLILVPRETPFSTLHLENMLRLSRAGATILPPNPGFYRSGNYGAAEGTVEDAALNVADLVDFVVARILDHLGIEHTLLRRWGEN